jgi:hypothetical protein
MSDGCSVFSQTPDIIIVTHTEGVVPKEEVVAEVDPLNQDGISRG